MARSVVERGGCGHQAFRRPANRVREISGAVPDRVPVNRRRGANYRPARVLLCTCTCYCIVAIAVPSILPAPA